MNEGITLDALAVRAEIEDAADLYDMDETTGNAIADLTDEEINQVIHDTVDDEFWEAYDNARSTAIRELMRRHES